MPNGCDTHVIILCIRNCKLMPPPMWTVAISCNRRVSATYLRCSAALVGWKEKSWISCLGLSSAETIFSCPFVRFPLHYSLLAPFLEENCSVRQFRSASLHLYRYRPGSAALLERRRELCRVTWIRFPS